MVKALPALAATLAAMSLSMLAGCMADHEYVDPMQNAAPLGGSSSQTPLTLQGGILRGDFGPRTGFDGAATEMQGTTDKEWRTSTVTIARSEDLRGTGMVILWTNGLTLADLDAGTHEFTYDPTSLDAPPVTMNVCSGTDASSIDYDTPAEHVTATVSETEHGRSIQLHTDTHVIDEATGTPTNRVETSDTTFELASP